MGDEKWTVVDKKEPKVGAANTKLSFCGSLRKQGSIKYIGVGKSWFIVIRQLLYKTYFCPTLY